MDAGEWDARYEASDRVWPAGPNRFVEEEVARLTPGTALDLAAGEGRNAIWLAEQGWQVVALDFSRAAVEKGRASARERGVDVEWILADASTHPFEQWPHDLVLIAYLQLPTMRMAEIVARAGEAVGPGGTLLIVGHDRSNLEEGYGGPQDADVLLQADELVQALDGTELTVERAGRVTRQVETDDGTRTAIDTLLRARRP